MNCTPSRLTATVFAIAMLATTAAAAETDSPAPTRSFGIGFTIGQPSAVDFKWWANDLFGLNAGFGAHYFGAQIGGYVDAEFHVAGWVLGGRAPSRLYLGPSFSVGHAFRNHYYGYVHHGQATTYGAVGAVVGYEVDFWFPLGIFIEVRPEVGVFGHAGAFDFGAHVGARYRF